MADQWQWPLRLGQKNLTTKSEFWGTVASPGAEQSRDSLNQRGI